MTHDTSEPTTDFTSSNSPANFVSRSCHLVLHCLDQVTHHNHTRYSFSLYLNRPLLDGNLIAIESRDDGREQGEERRAFQLET